MLCRLHRYFMLVLVIEQVIFYLLFKNKFHLALVNINLALLNPLFIATSYDK